MRMREWMKLIPATDLKFYKKAGFLGEMRPGRRTALIVVDVTMGFCGSEGLSLDQAIEEFSSACGPAAWEAMPRVARLIDLFRDLDLPIVYTLSDDYDVHYSGKATKSPLRAMNPKFNEFPAQITPRKQDWTLSKTKASAFFQTPLTSYLTKQGVDTLVFCGVSTSGCVRASVVDGFSNGYRTFVVDECCFDRSEFAHAANLFDMNAKYSAVLSLEEVEAMMGGRKLAAAE
jgi:maleamate amidohydrolase